MQASHSGLPHSHNVTPRSCLSPFKIQYANHFLSSEALSVDPKSTGQRTKRCFAVVQTFRCLNYLHGCPEAVTIFTNPCNILFSFHPTAVQPSLRLRKVLHVIRWALYLSALSYTIEHVYGDLNKITDIMTRWIRGFRNRLPTAH